MPASKFSTPLAVFAVAAGLFMGLLDLSIVSIVIPEIGRDLDAEFTEMSWVVNAYILVTAAAIIPAGKLGDAIGRKRVFGAGMAIFAIASLLCGIAPNAGSLIAFRTLQGLGGAGMVTLSLALLTAILPAEKQRLGWMVWSATGGLALAAGPSLGGVLTELSTWRWVFIVNVPIAAVALVLLVFNVSERKGASLQGVRLDVAGLATVVGGLTLLSLGLLQGQEWGWASPRVISLLAISVVLLAAFLIIETNVSAPMVPLRYFRKPRFAAACAGWFGAMFAFISIFFFLPVYLEVVRDYSVLKASLALSPGPFMGFLMAPVAQVLARRRGAPPVVVLGLAIIGTAVFVTSFVDTGWSYGQLIALALLTGVGFGLAVPTLTELAMSALDEHDLGVGAGVFNTVRQVAGVIAIASLGAALQERMVSTFSSALTSSAALPEGIKPAVQAEFERRAAQRGGLTEGAIPPEIAAEVQRLASVALVDGLQLVFLVAATVAAAALVVAIALLVRSREPSIAVIGVGDDMEAPQPRSISHPAMRRT
jgi:EmrB/QacA subfamily drug resistance transporter